MSIRLLKASIAATVVYAASVALFGYEGFIAITINFWRVAMATAVVVMYIHMLPLVFREVPPPSRDYLVVGIVLMALSAVGFSISNEAARVFEYPTNIYKNPLSGVFSLFLASGCLFLLLAPGIKNKMKGSIAIMIGLAVGIAVVFIAPLFR